MASNLFRPPPPDPNWQGDPYAFGGRRVWDDYQFRQKGIRRAGGPMAVQLPPSLATSVHEGVRLLLPLMSSADRVDPLITEWSIVGGPDAAQFQVFQGPPWTLRWNGDGVRDFETPLDANGDNVYVVQVRVIDKISGMRATQTISVTVLNVVMPIIEEPPDNIVVPTVIGVTEEGITLVCVTLAEHWDGTPPIGFTYQWYRVGLTRS